MHSGRHGASLVGRPAREKVLVPSHVKARPGSGVGSTMVQRSESGASVASNGGARENTERNGEEGDNADDGLMPGIEERHEGAFEESLATMCCHLEGEDYFPYCRSRDGGEIDVQAEQMRNV
ncbi:hypothetical protein NLG97_g3538 [Lecanicillium saksenae]|uniref:Uncharacterized protein n=1 Tax=Lecanicillium saksenae TaxID=468837 RepID=A0ACC1R0H1_9HYPO|nr:hypothetical protein NLG97_g3538 [Lecanicillium saksenae]